LLLPALLLGAARFRRWPRAASGPGAGALAAVLALPLIRLDAAQADFRYQDAGAWTRARATLAADPPATAADRNAHALTALAATPWFFETARPAYLPLDEVALLDTLVPAVAARAPGSPSAAYDLATLGPALQLDAAERLLASLAASGQRFIRARNRRARGSSSPASRAAATARVASASSRRPRSRRAIRSCSPSAPRSPTTPSRGRG
jgi:hypothetical protein